MKNRCHPSVKNLNRKLLAGGGEDYLPRDFVLPSSSPSTLTMANNNNNTATDRKPLKATQTFDSSMALTVLVLLTALFFMGFFSVYIQRCSEENPMEISRRRRQQRRTSSTSTSSMQSSKGVDDSIVGSLPLFSYEKKAKEGVDCVVCLSEFEERELVKLIPNCGHVFHPECIDMWLFSHASCPLCRSTQLLCPLPFPSPSESDNVLLQQQVILIDQTMGGEGMGMRRIRSCSSLGERDLLHGRSSSC